MGRFFFDIPLEGVLDYEEKIHRWHERERRELSFDGYINELSKYLNSLGFYVEVSTGNTWQGLRLIIVGESMGGTRLIAVHPKDPNTAYVAATGHLFGPNPERGLYKTTDGGKTWRLVKFISNKAGFVDIVIDPTNPDIVYFGTKLFDHNF